MKLNYKLLLFFITVSAYIFIISLFWQNIQIPFSDTNGTIGQLTIKKINSQNDTLKFFLFIFPPLIFNFIFVNFFYRSDLIKIKELYYNNEISTVYKFKEISLIFFLLSLFIIFQFFQTDFPSISYLDTLHDGDYLAPIKNYLYFGGYWTSTFTVHGGENLILPLIAYKFLNLNIASIKLTLYFTTLLVKFLSIVLSYQISQLANIKKELKIIFFTVLSLFTLSLSSYVQVNYINIRDLFVIIFFILFIDLYTKRLNIFFIYFLTLTTVLSFLFHYDTGAYLHVLIFLIFIHLLFSNKIKESFSIIIFLTINWLLVLVFFGANEVGVMFEQFLHIAKNIDKIHGLEYPQPFFSMGEGDGSRATKSLVTLLFLGFVTSSVVLNKNKYFTINEKCLLVFFYIYTIFSFKNALGRSDGPHMVEASEWISILIFFYLFHFFFYKFYFFFNFKKILKNSKLILTICLFALVLSEINLKKTMNYNSNFMAYINNDDKSFLKGDRGMIVKEISALIKDVDCIQNFTTDLSLPYLLGKPNCTKFVAPWLISGNFLEKQFVDILKKNKVKYIIYMSPAFRVDGIKTSDRLKTANSFIKKNYNVLWEKDGYIIVKLSNT
jgi:hypothetical protein